MPDSSLYMVLHSKGLLNFCKPNSANSSQLQKTKQYIVLQTVVLHLFEEISKSRKKSILICSFKIMFKTKP